MNQLLFGFYVGLVILLCMAYQKLPNPEQRNTTNVSEISEESMYANHY